MCSFTVFPDGPYCKNRRLIRSCSGFTPPVDFKLNISWNGVAPLSGFDAVAQKNGPVGQEGPFLLSKRKCQALEGCSRGLGQFLEAGQDAGGHRTDFAGTQLVGVQFGDGDAFRCRAGQEAFLEAVQFLGLDAAFVDGGARGAPLATKGWLPPPAQGKTRVNPARPDGESGSGTEPEEYWPPVCRRYAVATRRSRQNLSS